MLCLKWEASSKNNALYYRVGCGSSVSKGIIFYLLTGMFLIALVEKLMPEIQLAVAVCSIRQIILKKRYGISFFAGAITVGFLANKK